MAKKKTSQKKEAAPLTEPMADPLSHTVKVNQSAQRDSSPDRTEKLKQLNAILLKQTVEKREQVSQLQTQIEDMGLEFSFVSDTERDIFRFVLSAFVINLSVETHERLRALEVEKEREIERARIFEERVKGLEEELRDEMERKRLVEMERIEVLGRLDVKGKEVFELGKIVNELEREKVELQGKFSRVCDERDGLERDSLEKEGVICNLRSEKGVTEKRLEECEILVEKLCDERDELERDAREKERVICNLRSEKGVTGKRLEECEILVQKLKVRIEEEIKEKETKFSLFGNEKEGLEKKILDMEKERELEASKLGLQIEGLKCKNTEKEREIGDLKSTIDGKIENIEGLKREVEFLQLAIEEAKKKGFWSWIYPAATTVLAAVSFVYATRAR